MQTADQVIQQPTGVKPTCDTCRRWNIELNEEGTCVEPQSPKALRTTLGNESCPYWKGRF